MPPTTINVSDPSNTLFTKSDFEASITELVLGIGWTEISSYTFNDSSMVVISIPSTLTTISDYAFYDSTDLTTIRFTFDSTLTTIGIQAFGNTQLSVIYLPSSLTTIGNAAFHDCELLTTVVIKNPSNTSVNTNSFPNSPPIHSAITFMRTDEYNDLSSSWKTIFTSDQGSIME